MFINRYLELTTVLLNYLQRDNQLCLGSKTSLWPLDIWKHKNTPFKVKINFIAGNNSCDLDSVIGAINYSIFQNLNDYNQDNHAQSKATKLNDLLLHESMDKLEDPERFFVGNAQNIYIPLINNEKRSIVLGKPELIFASSKLGLDFQNYNDIRFLFEKNSYINQLLFDRNIDLSFEYWLFDHNNPEKTMDKISASYLNNKPSIYENFGKIIDHHAIVNLDFVNKVPWKMIEIQGSCNTLLVRHFDKELDGLLLNDFAGDVSSEWIQIEAQLKFTSLIIKIDSMDFNKTMENKRWNHYDLKVYNGLLKNKNSAEDLKKWANEFIEAKFDPRNVNTENWMDYLDSDYKQFAYTSLAEFVGYSAIPFSFKGIVDNIGIEKFIKGYNEKIKKDTLKQLFLLFIYPDFQENGEVVWKRECFGFMTETQAHALKVELEVKGYTIKKFDPVEEILGSSLENELNGGAILTSDLYGVVADIQKKRKYYYINVEPFTFDRKIFEPIVKNIFEPVY